MAYKARARSRKKKQKKILRKRVIFLMFLVVLLVAGYVVARIPHSQIQDIVVIGNELVLTEEITDHIQDFIERSDSVLFPQTQWLFFDSNSAEEEITNSFPEIRKTSIAKDITGDITVEISERTRAYVFCAEPATCYEIDRTGYLYRLMVEEQEEKSLIFRSRQTYGIGDIYLSEDQLGQLFQLTEALDSDNLQIIEIYDYSLGTIVLVTAQGTKILIPKNESYDDTYSLIKKMIQSGGFPTSSQLKDFKEPFVYINAQFGKKIFSCLRSEICESNYPLQKNDDSL